MLNRILSILVIAVCFSGTAQKKQVVLSVTPKDAEVGENVVITVETNIKGEIALDNLPSSLLNIYLNQEIKSGQFVNNPAVSFKAFQKWYEIRVDKKIAKLKSDRGIEKATLAKQDQMNQFNDRKQDIINLFIVSKLLSDAKLIFVRKYNNNGNLSKAIN